MMKAIVVTCAVVILLFVIIVFVGEDIHETMKRDREREK